MTNHAAGHNAEIRAAEFLRKNNFKILELNWRTRYCEIDIVAEKDDVIYFVEVKYRRSNRYGTGLDYITPKKLSQMSFAAELWVSNHDWRGGYELAAIGMDGENVEFISQIS